MNKGEGASQAEKKVQEELGMISKDGAICIYKNKVFQAMTNSIITCTGFVSKGGSVEGYLVEVIPANWQCLNGGQNTSERYVLISLTKT